MQSNANRRIYAAGVMCALRIFSVSFFRIRNVAMIGRGKNEITGRSVTPLLGSNQSMCIFIFIFFFFRMTPTDENSSRSIATCHMPPTIANTPVNLCTQPCRMHSRALFLVRRTRCHFLGVGPQMTKLSRFKMNALKRKKKTAKHVPAVCGIYRSFKHG